MDKKSVAQLTKELEHNPENERVRQLLLRHYDNPGSMEKYYELLNWFIDNTPKNPIHDEVGIGLIKTDAYRRSKRHWLRQLKENPDDVIVLQHIAAFCTLCDQKDSIKFLKRARRIEPNNEELARRLAHAYKLLLMDTESKATAKRAVQEMMSAVNLYENRTDEHSYLLQYFDFEVRDFARIALSFGLLKEAQILGEALLNRMSIDSNRLGASHSKSRSGYYRSTAFGLSIAGLTAIQIDDLEVASNCLARMCELPMSQFIDLQLANELLKRKERKIVLRFLAYQIEGWKSLAERYNSNKVAPADSLLFNHNEAEQNIEQLEKWVGQIERGRTPRLFRDSWC